MFPLIETIRIWNGEPNNLAYHQRRMQAALDEFAAGTVAPDLDCVFRNRHSTTGGVLKCRVVYDREIRSVAIEPYAPRPVRSLKLITDNTILYNHKWEDRTALNHLFDQRGKYDDILIVKDGKITDSSYANVVFRKGDQWITPADSLLAGTHRQYLLDKGMIRQAVIKPDQLKNYSGFKLINAMLLTDGPEIAMENIH